MGLATWRPSRPGTARRDSLRQATIEAAGLDDADTADLFTEVSRTVDKARWFIEAHLQE